MKYHAMLRVARAVSENVGDGDAATTAGLVPALTGQIFLYWSGFPSLSEHRGTQVIVLNNHSDEGHMASKSAGG